MLSVFEVTLLLMRAVVLPEGYKESCRWWEAVVMLRKFMIQLILVFVSDPIIQGKAILPYERIMLSSCW